MNNVRNHNIKQNGSKIIMDYLRYIENGDKFYNF